MEMSIRASESGRTRAHSGLPNESPKLQIQWSRSYYQDIAYEREMVSLYHPDQHNNECFWSELASWRCTPCAKWSNVPESEISDESVGFLLLLRLKFGFIGDLLLQTTVPKVTVDMIKRLLKTLLGCVVEQLLSSI